MSDDDLANEIQAIQAIYDDNTIRPTTPTPTNPTTYILSIPQTTVSVRLRFPSTYPASPPRTQGVESTGPTHSSSRKGDGLHVLGVVDEVLDTVFSPGNVCLFDLVQALESRLSSSRDDPPAAAMTTTARESPPPSSSPAPPPRWHTSRPLTAKKSTFLARAATVAHAGPDHVRHALAHLRETDRKTARATHVMTAYRIRAARDGGGVTYEECEDDGEAGAGRRLLELLQRMEVWDVLVVVSRWYGGVKLGPDRFRCIGSVAREAVVRLREEEEGEEEEGSTTAAAYRGKAS